jgi:pimeloyl-ACP methyl ester carboxylesterase
MADRQSVQLDDGRRLDFVEFGDVLGVPSIYLHGTPGSALEAAWMHEHAIAHGVRLVSIDRPGYQKSERSERLGPDETARDVAQLARLLSLERYGVIGFSGGAGSALTTAATATDSVSIVHLGGGMGPLVPGAEKVMPVARRVVFSLVGRSSKVSRPLIALAMRRLSKTLRDKLKIPTLAALELLEGSSAGSQLMAAECFVRSMDPEQLAAWVSEFADAPEELDAIIGDMASLSSPWSFELSDLATPVEIWHGTADAAVPLPYALALSRSLPNARLHALEGEGHFVFLTHADEVCASIRAAAN